MNACLTFLPLRGHKSGLWLSQGFTEIWSATWKDSSKDVQGGWHTGSWHKSNNCCCKWRDLRTPILTNSRGGQSQTSQTFAQYYPTTPKMEHLAGYHKIPFHNPWKQSWSRHSCTLAFSFSLAFTLSWGRVKVCPLIRFQHASVCRCFSNYLNYFLYQVHDFCLLCTVNWTSSWHPF